MDDPRDIRKDKHPPPAQLTSGDSDDSWEMDETPVEGDDIHQIKSMARKAMNNSKAALTATKELKGQFDTFTKDLTNKLVDALTTSIKSRDQESAVRAQTDADIDKSMALAKVDEEQGKKKHRRDLTIKVIQFLLTVAAGLIAGKSM